MPPNLIRYRATYELAGQQHRITVHAPDAATARRKLGARLAVQRPEAVVLEMKEIR